jgi:hypothetical protein
MGCAEKGTTPPRVLKQQSISIVEIVEMVGARVADATATPLNPCAKFSRIAEQFTKILIL